MLYNLDITEKERFDMPLTGLASYRVRNNIIYTQFIEINAVRHCNLSCRSCSHSSPIAEKAHIIPTVLGKDLRALSHFLRCETLRILGGEPLLHPSLKELLKEIRNSGISTNICLVTNGTLLQLLDEKLAAYIDEVQISLYPLKAPQIDKIQKEIYRLIGLGMHVELKETSHFRESIAQNQTQNDSIISMVYNSCVSAHAWRYLTVNNGRLYRCPQSLVFAESTSDYDDSIDIYRIVSTNNLLKFLENNNPCKACSQCLGSVGKLFPHEQIKRKDWFATLPLCPEEGIDFAYAKNFRIF
ncbi:MAG: radical SAM protein [Lachnospiraceae bacterium]|jgi:organic radical activating enzyme|nr:radical SAM protein [Lachnospiraceae bacterium]